MFNPPNLNINKKYITTITPPIKYKFNKYKKYFTDKKSQNGKNLIDGWTFVVNNNIEELTNDEMIF